MSRFFDLEEGTTCYLSGEISYGRASLKSSKPRIPTRLALEIEQDNRQVPEGPKSRYGIVRKSLLRPHGPFWDWIFLILCVIAISLDPLFLYIPVINDQKKCLRMDKKLGIVAIILRS